MSKPQAKSNIDIALAKAADNFSQGFTGKVTVTSKPNVNASRVQQTLEAVKKTSVLS